MEILALAVAVFALVVAVAARARASGGVGRIDDVAADGRRRVENLTEEVGIELEKLRQLVADLNDGAALTREQILEGRLWRDVMPDEGASMCAAGDVHVLDVRTPEETAGGILPGAQLIPIQELEQRMAEVPRDSARMLVYCAGGGRSAAACELLSTKGYSGLHNLAGGISSWSGPLERPASGGPASGGPAS
jgi:rhodanese-related sulfurtransferase